MPLSNSAASVGLGLVAATTWGGSDFAGGLGARRSPALLIAVSGHAVTLFLLLGLCGFWHLPVPHPTEFLEGAVGGLEGSLALVAFYRALSMGAMGLTAALTGLLTALVPVLYGLWRDGFPAPLAVGGLVLGCVAIWLVSHAGGQATPPEALWLGALSGAGFGLQMILFKVAANGGVVWALTSARIGGVAGMTMILLFAWPRAGGEEGCFRFLADGDCCGCARYDRQSWLHPGSAPRADGYCRHGFVAVSGVYDPAGCHAAGGAGQQEADGGHGCSAGVGGSNEPLIQSDLVILKCKSYFCSTGSALGATGAAVCC